MRDHIILCGLGKVGFSTLQLLHSQGEPVVVVAREIDRDWEHLAAQLADRVIRKDARLAETLHEAEIRTARSIIAVTDNDLKNLAIAIEAHRLVPELRSVVRVHDDALAQRVRRHIPVGTVLNSADLAAPAFVAAALGDDIVRAFDIEDAHVIVSRRRVVGVQDGVGQQLSSVASRTHCLPLALYRGTGGGARLIAIATDAVLQADDELVAATVQHPGETGAPGARNGSRRSAPVARWVRAPRPLLHVLREAWRNASRPMRAAFVAFNILLVSSVIVYRYALGLSWVDAAYFTVCTLTTVGYGDINLLAAPAAVKLFGCATMLTGAALFVVYFTMLTDYLVTRRFEQVLGRPQTTLADHFVVVGLGNLGNRVAVRLRALGYPVIAIERRADAHTGDDIPADIPVVSSEASLETALEQAGTERARAVLAVTDDDVLNFRAAHLAESMSSSLRVVVRVFDTTLASKLGPSLLGIDRTLSPSQAAAATFAAAALARDVLQGFTVGGNLLMLRQIRGADLSGYVDPSPGEAEGTSGGVVLLRRQRGDSGLTLPQPCDVHREDDVLVVVEQYDRASHSPLPCPAAVLAEQEQVADAGERIATERSHSLR